MGIFAWLVLGGLAGWVASLVMGTHAKMGIVLNVVVGIIGAVIGGYVFRLFGKHGVTGFTFYSFAVALVGALILLALVKAIRK